MVSSCSDVSALYTGNFSTASHLQTSLELLHAAPHSGVLAVPDDSAVKAFELIPRLAVDYFELFRESIPVKPFQAVGGLQRIFTRRVHFAVQGRHLCPFPSSHPIGARHQIAVRPGANAWLTTIPSRPAFCLNDVDFRTSLCLRFAICPYFAFHHHPSPLFCPD